MQNTIRFFTRIYLKLVLLTLAVEFITRIILLFNDQTTDINFTLGEWIAIFVLGALNDVCIATLSFVFMWLFLLGIGRGKFARPWGYILLGTLTTAFCYVSFCHTIFDEYGSVVPTIAASILGYWLLSFAFRLFVPSARHGWTTAWFGILLSIYTGLIIFNGVSEYFFWNEFGVRYNFIAVDYLVYTTEVVGNIMESYPVIPMMGLLLVVTLTTAWLLFHSDLHLADKLQGAAGKVVVSIAYLVAAVAAIALLSFNTRFQNSENVYVNELQANGLYKFYDAFMKNELDYQQFYITTPDAKAIMYAEYGSTGDNLRHITGITNAPQRNIVLITIESMSASFMERFGNTEHLTPVLDSLYTQGLAFDKLLATGNRTVRGLEAVTLSLPPCPGQSIIKRQNNSRMHSTGALLREKGYNVRFFYGGNSYFDNMKTFFGGNGYDIIDKSLYTPDEITFANIWGVCDEDAYRKVIKTLTEDARSGKPFFAHVLSVSNHRPFTYPAGRISIPNDAKSRAGGVMYSDYALGQFFDEARRQPWFANTVFVITADHCASSAGKTEIPLAKYHIPAVIYAPGIIKPAYVTKTISQIDLMPTLFTLLGMDYDSHFYGRNVLDENYKPRAFIATYQDLGYLEGDVFTILSPVKRSEQFRITSTSADSYDMEQIKQPEQYFINRAASFYQSSSEWNKR
ncbi:MAG: sulfatase-like hydrolase/transferase [Alistipes sp.]